MVGYCLHVFLRYLIPFSVGCNLLDFGNQPAHEIAADEDETLSSRQFDPFPCCREAPGDPVCQHALGLRSKLDLTPL